MKKVSDTASKFPAFESCGNCSEDGWIPGGGYAQMTRCSCWRAWQERIQQVVAAAAKDRK